VNVCVEGESPETGEFLAEGRATLREGRTDKRGACHWLSTPLVLPDCGVRSNYGLLLLFYFLSLVTHILRGRNVSSFVQFAQPARSVIV